MTHVISIIDEDRQSVARLQPHLQQANLASQTIADGQYDLDNILRHNPSVILMEVSLTDISGLDVCKLIRKVSDVPIIFISKKCDEIDRLLAYEYGADDFICKPFSPREVVAKIKALLKRQYPVEVDNTPRPASNVKLNPTRLQASYRDKKTVLTSVEFKILKLLASKPGDIFTRSELIKSVYEDNRVVSQRTIDSHIKKLRTKMTNLFPNNEVIHSAYGTGYKYEQ